MKIRKVDDKPMVIHTKEKAKIHAHEPKGAKIKGSNIYTVERGPKTAGAKVTNTDRKKSYRKSTIHQSESKNKGLSRFKRNYRESNTSIKTKNTNLHIAGRTGALAAGAVTEHVEGGQEVSQAADQLMIAKWVIRNLGYRYGYNVTFAPKITAGKAGSGLHVHMRIMKDGKNQMLKDGVLSETARKAIAGMMVLAPSITAFGNTNPTSYFRLVPHQEAPTNVCWGDRNRSVLVRVPLGWAAKTDMCTLANPLEAESHFDTSQKQTVEMRSPDGSADLYQLLAGLAVACRHGFEIENALDIAEKTYVNVNIHQKENEDKLKSLAQLPDSCEASADCLQQQRAIFEQYNVFSPAMIDGIIRRLRGYEDKTLRADLEGKPMEMLDLVHKYFHCG